MPWGRKKDSSKLFKDPITFLHAYESAFEGDKKIGVRMGPYSNIYTPRPTEI
jgi:hypothetical protein